jgi:septum formation protein
MTPVTPLPTAWPTLVLGSTSKYRAQLLERLGLPFVSRAPGTDETTLQGESPRDTAARLALAKALAVANLAEGDEVIIGSDQVADLHGQALGKPGHHAAAVAQLQAMSGQTVLFHTALAVVRARPGQAVQVIGQSINTVSVVFRPLSATQIETYLRLEQPYDCAGSAKAEGLGTVLLERIDSNDPSALIGLPLITLCSLLCLADLDPLAWHARAHQPAPPSTPPVPRLEP